MEVYQYENFSPIDSFPQLRLRADQNIPEQLKLLVSEGSKGESCVAKACLELWFRDGFCADLVWTLDDDNFNALVKSLIFLRNSKKGSNFGK